MTFDQLPLHMEKVNTFKTPEMRLYFDSDVLRRMSQLFSLDLFFILSFLPKLTVK